VRGHRPPRSFHGERPRRSVAGSEYLTEGTTPEGALAALLRWLEDRFLDNQLVAAGHRVVHGGSLYTGPVLIDASVTAELCRLIPLAPLH
jgi:acetate kinase